MNAQQRASASRLRALLDQPVFDRVAVADCYVQLLGEQLHTLAQTGFSRDGRGAIEIDLRGIDLRHATGGLPITYYPADEADDDWPAEAESVLAEYNPRRETVVILYQDEIAPLLYVLE